MTSTPVRMVCAWTIALALAGCAGEDSPGGIPPLPRPGAASGLRLDAPAEGQVIEGTFEVAGSVMPAPADQALLYRLYDSGGALLATGLIRTEGEAGQPGVFADVVVFDPAGLEGAGQFELLERDAAGGAVLSSAAVNVVFGRAGAQAASRSDQALALETPRSGASVSSPFELKVALSTAPLDSDLFYRIYDVDGQLIGAGPLAAGADPGGGVTFAAEAEYVLDSGGAGRVMVVDQDTDSGVVLSRAVAEVTLAPSSNTLNQQAWADSLIAIESPVDRAVVGNPFRVEGRVALDASEVNLVYRLYDAQGELIGSGPVEASGEPDQPAAFAVDVAYPAGVQGAGQLEILDQDTAEGLVFTSEAVSVFFGAAPAGADVAMNAGTAIIIDAPLMGDIITGPLAVKGAVAPPPPGNALVYRVYDSAGRLIGSGTIPVTIAAADQGGAGATPLGEFSATVSYVPGEGSAGRVQVLDIDAADGSVRGRATADVFLKDILAPGP